MVCLHILVMFEFINKKLKAIYLINFNQIIVRIITTLIKLVFLPKKII